MEGCVSIGGYRGTSPSYPRLPAFPPVEAEEAQLAEVFVRLVFQAAGGGGVLREIFTEELPVTWEQNKTAIRELWPNATIEPALASLFAERLSHLDQAILAEAIREARIQSRFPTPEIRDILDAYHKAQRMSPQAWQPRHYEKPLPPSLDVDPEVERKTVRDIRYLLDNVKWEEAEIDRLIERILNAMDKGLIGPAMTHRQLVPLQVLKRRLRDDKVHPDALAVALKIWPHLEDVPPGATEAPKSAEQVEPGVDRPLERMAS